jgi:hypothetical protein
VRPSCDASQAAPPCVLEHAVLLRLLEYSVNGRLVSRIASRSRWIWKGRRYENLRSIPVASVISSSHVLTERDGNLSDLVTMGQPSYYPSC